jgi:hypothetical protein
MFGAFWPQPVPLILGGRAWAFHQFRISDLAYLEGWARNASGSPYALTGAAMGLTDDRERADALRASYDAAEATEKGFADPAVSGVLATRAGVVEQLAVSARTEEREELGEALEGALPGEVDTILAVAWAIPALDFAQTVIDREIGVSLPPKRAWHKAGAWQEGLWKLIEATGYTPEQIGGLYLSQWEIIRSGGQWEPSDVVSPPDNEACRPVLTGRKRFWLAAQDQGEPTNGAPKPR